MNIALLGASGGTGRLILRGGAARGHRMSVLVRDPERLGVALLLASRVVRGDAVDRGCVRDVIDGADAVVATISSRGTPLPAASLVAEALLRAAAETGVERLVLASSYGMVADRPVVVASLLRRVLAKPFRDQQRSDDLIQASSTQWTIVRATRLTDRDPTGEVQLTPEPLMTGPYSLPRGDFGRELLNLAERRDHLRTILNITGARP